MIDGISKAAIGVHNLLAANLPPEMDTTVIRIALDKLGVLRDFKNK